MPNARRLGLYFSLVVIAGVVVLSPRFANALGTKEWQDIRTYRSEGRGILPFNVSCSSTAWTVVQSSDAIRRSILMESIPENTLNVCISTLTLIGDPCGQGTPGIKLTNGSSLTDYTTIQWNCRAVPSATLSSSTVSGYSTRDKGDFGAIYAPSLQ
jgi:hypothetical protein